MLPKVPTSIAAGFSNSAYDFWIGACAPSATPRPIVEPLHLEVTKALHIQSMQDKLATMGADPMPMDPRQFDEHVRKEIQANAELVKTVGIKAN